MLACVGLFSAVSFATTYHPQSSAPQDGSKKQSTEKTTAAPAAKKETATPAPKKETTATSPKKQKLVKKTVKTKTAPQPVSTIEQKKK